MAAAGMWRVPGVIILVLALGMAGCTVPAWDPGPDREQILDALQQDLEVLLDRGEVEAAFERIDRDVGRHPTIAELYAERALLALDTGRYERAQADLRRAVETAVAAGDRDQAQIYGAILADVLEQPSERTEQAAMDAEALPETPEILDALEFWDALRQEALDQAERGDLQGAVELLEQALTLAEGAFGSEHRLTVESILDLADLTYATGDSAGAEALLLFALERSRVRPGSGHPWTLEILATLSDLMESEGRVADALEFNLEAVQAGEATLGPDATEVIDLELLAAQRFEAVGDYARGAERLETLCVRIEQRYGRHHERHAECLEQSAILLGRGGDLDGAREQFGEVLAIRRGLYGERHELTLRTRLDLASLEHRQGDFERAAARIDAVLADLPPDSDLEHEVLEAQARLLLETGDLPAAEMLAREVLEQRLEVLGGDHPLTLDALNLLGALYQRGGNLAAAEDTWTAVVDGYRRRYGVEHLATLTAMSNLGVVLEEQGAYDRAEPLLRTAMEVSERLLGPAHPQTLTSMNNLALLHESQGNFNRAEPLYRLPLEVLGRTLGDAHPRTIAVRNNLAFLYMMEGSYAQAAELFETVHAAWVETLGPGHQDTLRGLNNLGRAYRELGRLDAAADRIETALLERRDLLGDRHPDTVRSMIDLGLIERDRGNETAAEARLREALERAEDVLGPEHPYTFEALNALADLIHDGGRIDAAHSLRRMGFERRTRFFDRMLWVTSDNAREGYLRLHRPELDRYLQLLAELPPEIGARELLEVSLQRKGLLLKVTSEIRQISGLGLDPQMARLTDALTEAREELAALTLAGPGDEGPDHHLAQIRALEARIDELQGELGRASLRYREAIATLTVDDLVAHLPENGSLVDFLVYQRPDRGQGLLAAVLSRPAGQDVPEVRLVRYESMAPITALIQEFRAVIQDVDALDEDVAEVGHELWAAIWKPIAAHLPEAGTVYLVPDGVLNVLPFDALVDDEGRYLLETTDLHLLSSARDLVPSAVPPSSGGFLVFGGPDYDTEEAAGSDVLEDARRRSAARAAVLDADDGPEPVAAGGNSQGTRAARFDAMRSVGLGGLDARSAAELASLRAASRGLRGLSFSPLPGAELEGELIGRQVAATDVPHALFVGRAAQEQVLSDLDQPPRVLHMATHGFFLEADEELRRRLLRSERSLEVVPPPPGDNPLLRAGLAFAGVNSNAPFLGEIDTRNDGVLTALEVLALDLTGTELAVLSACDTGVGEIHEGEGVYGLRRAFQEAGVRQVVTSLWEVSDAGTQALMTAFYERMFAGKAPREAFRAAQLELMESPRWGYPFIWGAFVMVGK